MKSQPAPWSRPCSWLILVASLATTAPAAAQKLAILGLSSKDGDDEPAAALTNALRSEASADSDLQLSDSSALLSQLVVLHDCEIADAACRESIAGQLAVDELIYGAIRTGMFGHVVELHYATTNGSLTHASRELTIEGASDADLAAEARGLLRELRPSRTAEEPPLERVPALEPKRAPKPRPVPLEPEPQDESSSNDWLGYTLLGVAAISSGLMVYSWNEIDAAKSNVNFREYREAVGRADTGEMVDDVCAEAEAGEAYGLGERLENVRGACRRGETFEILQWVFAGTALLGAGFGTYFLLDDEGEPDAARASLLPMLGKNDAGLRVRLQL
jgi:hypothetical protein